jgi:hypothetical protein
MNAQKIIVKLFLQDPAQAHSVKMLPVFQSWIQVRAMEEHLMIDVADYDHVPDGPGIVLVTHEANVYVDGLGGRGGLSYQRKQPLPGTFAERLAAILRYTLQAAARLEDHPGLKFRTDEFSVKIADRLLAPNTPATLEAVKGDVQAVGAKLLGPVQLCHNADARQLFEVAVRGQQAGATLSDLLAKTAAPATVA